MKIKTTLLLSLLPILFTQNVLADNGFETNKFSPIQQFYYNLGENKSKDKYYRLGYSAAVKDVAILLKEYEAKIKRLEAGKFLIESSKIAYPEVYKTRTRDGYKIHIDAPVIERAFSADDLFLIPLYEGVATVYKEKKYTYETASNERPLISDGFSIPSMSQQKISTVPTKVKDVKNTIYVDIRHKNSTIKDFLDAYNANYAVSEDGYKVRFNSEAEKRRFCLDLTGEVNCYGLN